MAPNENSKVEETAFNISTTTTTPPGSPPAQSLAYAAEFIQSVRMARQVGHDETHEGEAREIPVTMSTTPPGSPDPAAALTIPRQPVEPFATAGIPISSGPIGPTVVSGGMFSTARRSQGNNSSASLSPAQHEIHRAAHDTYTGPCPAVRGRGGVRGGLRRVQHTFRPGNTHGSSATMHNDDSSDSQAEEADRSTAYESEEDMPLTTAGTRR